MNSEETMTIKKQKILENYAQSIFYVIAFGVQAVVLGLLIVAYTSGRIESTAPVFNLSKGSSTAFNVAVLFKTALKIFTVADKEVAEEDAEKSRKIAPDYIITIAICMAGILMWLFFPNLYIK